MTQNKEKLSLRQHIRRYIKRRKAASPVTYSIIAVILVVACIILNHFQLKVHTVAYNGIAETAAFTATFTGNIYAVGDGQHTTAQEYASYFDEVREMFSSSDYISVPLGDPILTDDINTYTKGSASKFAERYFNSNIGDALFECGITDATLCNSNIFRYGSKGALETSRTLEIRDILTSGLDMRSASDSAVASVFESEEATIVHVGVEASSGTSRDYSLYDIRTYNDNDNNIISDISLLRSEYPSAFIAVTVSWSDAYLLKPNSYMKRLSRNLIDAGANVVIGSGVHMLMPIEDYNGGYIFYGLGNLVSDEAYTMAQRGAILNCAFSHDGTVALEVVPLSVKNGVPYIVDSSIFSRILTSDLSSTTIYDSTVDGRIVFKSIKVGD